MPQNFNNQLEQLRTQFLAGLGERARQIEELWHHLRYVRWSEPGLETLHMLAHRLVGSGASFGFPDISSSAKLLDVYLREQEEFQQSPGGVEREAIDQMVVNLIRNLKNAQPNAVPQAAEVPSNHGQGKLVYVVDDDRALSALIATYLLSSGFSVEQFDTPSACIQQLSLHTPHAILMDLGFQGESIQGLEAVEHIKIRLGNSVPIILLSARTDMNARLRALRAGCANYLTKPIDFERLVSTLTQSISSYTAPCKVMIVDDEELVANYHAEILRSAGMEVITVTQPLQSLQRAAVFKPDLVVLDMHMPNVNGFELATLLRQEQEFLVLPIIFITADTSASLRNSLESLGVNAVLTKPVSADQLISESQRAIKETVRLKNRIARVTQRGAQHQQITRSYFFGAVDNELQQQYLRVPQNTDEHIAVYYLGVNGMDSLYEHYGQAGIVLLHEKFCEAISRIINTEEQWTDISNLVVCVLTGDRSNEQHQQRATQIINHLKETAFEIFNQELALDTSIGITYLDKEYGSAASVLLHAEKAYEKARTHEVDIDYPTLTDEVEEQKPLKINFDQGLPLDKLSIAYQPMISLEDQKIEHYEALVRWKNENGDLVPAAQFLHYIANSALRIELDRWVLQNAINAISAQSNTRENASLFIHLSEETLQQKSFFAFAANVLHNSRLRGERRIVFMLSEQWINSQPAQAKVIIKALRDIHCGLCLNQAGSTNGTQDIINEFRMDFIKLSPTLTTKLSADTLDSLKSVTDLAKTSGSQIIATQVEDPKNLTTLWMQGVRLFQGFFIQSPEQDFNTRTDMEFYEADHKKY